MPKQRKNGATRESVYEYVEQKYGTMPEFLWLSLPQYAVLRRPDNKKWYAIIMDLPKSRLGFDEEEIVDIIDIKCSPENKERLLEQEGFLPAYHLSRKNWITALLDGTVDDALIRKLLDESYEIARGKAKPKLRSEPTNWLVPANPKYFDLVKAFEENDVILWKQSNSVIVGDTIYLYVTAPYSCILYKCKAVETNIPFDYTDDNMTMHKAMKIQRLHTYKAGEFGLEKLKEHGVSSVRGPRGIPYALRYQLERKSKKA